MDRGYDTLARRHPDGHENGTESHKTPDISFPRWAVSAVDRMRKTTGLGALLAAAIAIGFLEPQTWIQRAINGTLGELLSQKTTERAYLAMIQSIACVLLACLTPRPKVRLNTQMEAEQISFAERACRRIQICLMLVFFLWALYYAVTAINLFFVSLPTPGSGAKASGPFLVTLSTLTSLAFFWMYTEIGELTPAARTAPRHSRSPDITPQIMGVGLTIIIVGLSWYGFVAEVSKLGAAVDAVVACLSGVGLCLVVGRLGTKYRDPGPLAVSLLYLYAVLQLSAPLFEIYPAVHLAVTTIALPLKVLLWLVCVWAFTSGILGEYVDEVRTILDHREKW